VEIDEMMGLFCVDIVLGHAIGRGAFVTKKVIGPLAVLFDDDSEVVRKHAHAAFAMATISPIG